MDIQKVEDSMASNCEATSKMLEIIVFLRLHIQAKCIQYQTNISIANHLYIGKPAPAEERYKLSNLLYSRIYITDN